MQIINGYQSANDNLSKVFKFRLYHLNHPRLADWRRCRHGHSYQLDSVEKYTIDICNSKLVAVDCAGWIYKSFGVTVQCLESDPISLKYHKSCYIEPDLFTHRPTYTNDGVVLFRFPWFLKYAKLPEFVNFLEIWTESTVLLNFYPRFVQHNYLKYNLLDLVRDQTQLTIEAVDTDFWRITR